MANLSIRVDLAPGQRLGPGKIQLLECVARCGSISAAARSLDMSYKRAWDLVAELNELFAGPLVSTRTGGRSGGNARLTALGEEVVRAYRAIEQEAAKAAASELDRLVAATSRHRTPPV